VANRAGSAPGLFRQEMCPVSILVRTLIPPLVFCKCCR
jgi:hypothetical protein